MTSSQPELPARMYRNGREIDPVFDPEELVYHRCILSDLVDGKFSSVSIKFPDWSVNRGKYCRPSDVLLPSWLDFGVAEFKVKDVPSDMKSSGDTNFNFKIEHDPLEENYSHSELRVYKNGFHDKKVSVSSLVKKEFRVRLSLRINIALEPIS